MKIFVPMDGTILEEIISANDYEIKTWEASIQMRQMFNAKEEGKIKLVRKNSINIKNESLKKSLLNGSSISFYTC
ncbi:hypothetical protein [Aliarcobacter butzleri]|uniref:hypothetical protein n=1 Tax=Aliarcobacter butzleri TaxID=28197 RepID=UPI001EDB3C7E|nr:hypothetical protein [Aliarcobacter butzleri]MCG3683867.1 hypothetical protein [Aliarcobacter butzleri]